MWRAAPPSVLLRPPPHLLLSVRTFRLCQNKQISQEPKRSQPMKPNHLVLRPAAGEGFPDRLQCQGLKTVNKNHSSSPYKDVQIKGSVSFVTVHTVYMKSQGSEPSRMDDKLSDLVAVGNREMLPLAVLILATIVFLLQAFRRYARGRAHNIPPGDLSWPVVGETFSFMQPRLSTTIGCFMEQKMKRFGKIFASHLFGTPTIVSAEPELNRFLFKNDTRFFEPGWPRSFGNLVGKESISYLVGDAHKHMRSIILDFLSAERIRTLFLADMERLASLLIESWKEGSIVSSLDEATKFSFYIMAKNILSIGPEDPQIERLRKEYDAFTRGIVSFPLKIPGTVYWKALQEIAERKKEGSKNNDNDFLSWVIKNTDYSLEKIGDLMIHTLFAAHDTTSRSITLMIYFLDSCPEAIAQLREEHVSVVNSRKQNGESKLTYEDYKSMEFTQSVINETLRLGNIVGHIQRKVSVDVHFKGYLIPKGYNLVAHVTAVHLDPSLFEDPLRFNPWRWLPSSGVKKTSDFMPFGGGARHCSGSEIARLEMTVFLHHLILKYDWVVAEADHPMVVPYVDFAKGLPIQVQALSLY